jgi:hypothetical protein
MRYTSIGTLPGPLIVGEGRIGYDHIAPTGFSREWLNQRLAEEPDAAVLLVSSVEKQVAIEPDRLLYTLDNEAEAATGSLERITGAVDGQIVIVRASDGDRVVMLVDGGEVVEDELSGQFVVPGGDVTLRDGDMVVLEYNAAVGRWIGNSVFRSAEVSVAEPDSPVAEIPAHLPAIHATLHEAGGADVVVHDNLSGAGTNTHAQLDDLAKFLRDIFLESFDALVIEDGGAVKMTLEQAGGGDLTMVFSDGYTVLDCTPIISIPLTQGVDAQHPKRNYVYILQTAKTLAVSDSGWPAAEHIKVGFFYIQTAVEVAARGALVNQNINDHAASTSGAGVGQGHLTHIAERLRRGGAIWLDGCEGVATQDGNDLWVSIAVGLVSQAHPHTFAALDSDTAGAGDVILVLNDPDGAYRIINSLNAITKLSDGTDIGNNKYIKLDLWAVSNKSGTYSPMMLDTPSGQYNTASDAEIDVEGHADFSIPVEFALESTTGFLVASFVCKHTATAMEIVTTIDQRGRTPATAGGAGTGGGDVTAATVIVDNAITVGDGGAKGIQGRTASIADNGVMSVPGIGDGGLTNYDLKVGNPSDYGMIQFGNALLGRTSFNVGAIDLDGTVLIRNIGGPVTSEIEFMFAESVGATCRFALPKSAVGNATYNPRSMLLAGPAPADTDFVKVSYWQTQGIFHNLACDTAASGSDLGVQNDLEVEGIIYADNIKESTPGANITLGNDLAMAGNDILYVDVIRDILGNEQLAFGFAVAAVNYITVFNSQTGLPPSLVAQGDNADIDLALISKGTGKVKSLDDFDVTGDITLTGTVDGRDIVTDGAKLDGIEAMANVTDAANVAAAGAIMDGDITGDGLMIRTGAGNYTNRSIAVANAKLTVSNADGAAGNPTLGFGSVALADLSDGGTIVTADANLTDDALVRGKGGALGAQTSPVSLTDAGVMGGITQLNVDNLRLDGNTISGTAGAGLILIPPTTWGFLNYVTGTAAADIAAWSIYNYGWNASMVDTTTSLTFLQAYGAGGIGVAPTAISGALRIGTETNWAGGIGTRDSYMAFYTTLDGIPAEKTRITSGGQVGINCDPVTLPGATGNEFLYIHREGSSVNMTLQVASSGSPGGHRPLFSFRRSRGTAAARVKVEDNDALASFISSGYDGAAWGSNAEISFRVDGATSSGVVPTGIQFRTGTTGRTTRLTVQSDGDILVDGGTSVFVRDSALGFNSSVDGQLDLFADGEVEITTALIDLNAASIFAASLISGTDQADAGAAAGELYVDTNDDNTVKRGV